METTTDYAEICTMLRNSEIISSAGAWTPPLCIEAADAIEALGIELKAALNVAYSYKAESELRKKKLDEAVSDINYLGHSDFALMCDICLRKHKGCEASEGEGVCEFEWRGGGER